MGARGLDFKTGEVQIHAVAASGACLRKVLGMVKSGIRIGNWRRLPLKQQLQGKRVALLRLGGSTTASFHAVHTRNSLSVLCV